jgi:hypothetical protein
MNNGNIKSNRQLGVTREEIINAVLAGLPLMEMLLLNRYQLHWKLMMRNDVV